MFYVTTRFMFRSTHEKIVKSLKDDFEARLNAIRQRANEQEEHDEARVQAEKTKVSLMREAIQRMKGTIHDMRAAAIKGAFKREPRNIAATLVVALALINRDALNYPNWEKLPEKYRDAFYDIVYKLLGKPRKSKSSKKSTKRSA